VIASAPGKILLAGEYAVLEGHPAVIVAVDRRATARVAREPQRLSPFLEAARRELVAACGAASPEAERAARVVVDTAGFAAGGRKLGLGSSAAATVAAVAAALGRLDRVHELAHRAHARAQEPRGARGSGADVAASVHGGLLEVRGVPEAGPLAVRRLAWPSDLELCAVWTGAPADTPTLVAAVRGLRARDPAGHRAAIERIAAAAAQLARGDDIAAVVEGAAALAALGDAAGVPLVPPGFEAVAALAAAHGGAAKPTGAGGGDLVAALLPGGAAGGFRAAAASRGMILVPVRVSLTGVALAEAPDQD
jgi:phosphomevalonate kinase